MIRPDSLPFEPPRAPAWVGEPGWTRAVPLAYARASLAGLDLAQELARRAARLVEVSPKLRAKGKILGGGRFDPIGVGSRYVQKVVTSHGKKRLGGWTAASGNSLKTHIPMVAIGETISGHAASLPLGQLNAALCRQREHKANSLSRKGIVVAPHRCDQFLHVS
jgi:hypothetical protein